MSITEQSGATGVLAAGNADDPYALSPAAIADPPQTLWRALRQIGPGLILAGAIVGTGELIATTHLGAKVGFTLLWLVIVSCFIKVFVQVELGRYAISSGHTTMRSFKQLPGPGILIGAWWCGMMLITQLQLGAMIGGVGQALHMAFPGVSNALGATSRPELPWSIVAVLITIFLLARGSYGVLESVVTWLVVLFTLVTVACVALLPSSGHPIDWAAVSGGFNFHLPREAIPVALAMFGITGVGAAELVAYPYWCIEKGYARRAGARDDSTAWAARAKGWLRVMRLDAWVSCALYTVATLAFYFLGASVLHAGVGGGLPGNVGEMLKTLSKMYQPVLGQTAALLFIVIGVIAVLYSTVLASTGANSRALVDFLYVNRWISFERFGRVNWVRGFCIAFPIIDLALFYIIKNPVTMVIIGGFAQALTLPMIAIAAIYLRYRRTDPRLQPSRVWDVFLWLSLTGLSIAAYVGVANELRKLMK